MASRSDRSSNHFSPAMRTNFPRRSGNKDSPSSFHTKLPSRWIKVRSPQVEGGDVGARLRTRNSSVSKSIPGGQTTLWGEKLQCWSVLGGASVTIKVTMFNSNRNQSTPARNRTFCSSNGCSGLRTRSCSHPAAVSLTGFVQLLIRRHSCWVTNKAGTHHAPTQPTASNQAV